MDKSQMWASRNHIPCHNSVTAPKRFPEDISRDSNLVGEVKDCGHFPMVVWCGKPASR